MYVYGLRAMGGTKKYVCLQGLVVKVAPSYLSKDQAKLRFSPYLIGYDFFCNLKSGSKKKKKSIKSQ